MSHYTPRVSIGMPVYNAEKFLEKSLDSILAQTFTDFELIIVDNASTDRTQEICHAYAAKDPRISYHRNSENIGAAGNFNRVFQLSKGEYFKWASYDDICAPTFVERCVEVLDREHAVVLCHTMADEINEQGQHKITDCGHLNLRSPKPHQRLHDFFKINGWYHPNQTYGVIRSKFLRMTSLHGHYDTSDRVLLAELVLLGEFYEVPEYLFSRRVHAKIPSRMKSEDLATWFNPKNQGKIVLPKWRRYLEYVKGIAKAPIACDEKLRCYGEIINLGFLSSESPTRLGSLATDLTKATQGVFGKFYTLIKP